MYFGMKEKVTFVFGWLFLCLVFLLLAPWWMAIAMFVGMIPLYLQLRRLGSSGRPAKRPTPKD